VPSARLSVYRVPWARIERMGRVQAPLMRPEMHVGRPPMHVVHAEMRTKHAFARSVHAKTPSFAAIGRPWHAPARACAAIERSWHAWERVWHAPARAIHPPRGFGHARLHPMHSITSVAHAVHVAPSDRTGTLPARSLLPPGAPRDKRAPMHRLPAFLAVAAAATAVALGIGCSSSSNNSSDGGSSDAGSCAPIDSACGQPCDKGNALGVGQYCSQLQDCFGTPQAHLCSSLGSSSTHFCTFRCSVPEGGSGDAGAGDAGLPFPTDCGEGASCVCDNSGNCGCTPVTCLGK